FLQKSISLLSSREIYRVLVDKLPPILCIKYYSLFLYDKIRKTFRLTSHNHPDWNGDFEISLEESEIMGEAVR
ncbi:MAG: GGDEF domain-containing protein, partial [Nitrospinaceae bacterium]|nr:GGDEF domain-containing protein [Nitrospinaceae bacterium]NIR56044.1 GGDEF domain-containing protein [Nitrospinaceae bacterium]NIS86488.1 GGDEF domain-containing protein [Nitrospinaceae bacterium]NIT83323.1 GGDEF domain-containing protein [Nitrospinaceae bacterium]NIU45533.1 GGDEF domain-containing protein [Nitrospinaceae bacterium]